MIVHYVICSECLVVTELIFLPLNACYSQPDVNRTLKVIMLKVIFAFIRDFLFLLRQIVVLVSFDFVCALI